MGHDKPAAPDEVTTLLTSTRPGDDIILGCDATVRHTIWSSYGINDRAACIFDFINLYDMSIWTSVQNI